MYLTDSWRWFGRHSGYANLINFVSEEMAGDSLFHCNVPSPSKDLMNRIASVLGGGSHCCTGRDRDREEAFIRAWQSRGSRIGHILFFERHHPVFHQWDKAPEHLVTTIHHPPSQFKMLHRAVLDDLARVSSALVLYQRDLDYFEKYVGRGRVKFVHHGVDAEFFRPRESELPPEPRKVLFVGVNGRNLKVLHHVVQRVSAAYTDVEFELLVPSRRGDPQNHLYFSLLKRNPRVNWHSNLRDDELLKLYQSGYLLLLPLDHAGACNAHLEALSCGLPVVTNDVGGVRDYGAGTVFPVVAPGDAEGMADLVKRYLDDSDWRNEVSLACRKFAEQTLAWPAAYKQHQAAYAELTA